MLLALRYTSLCEWKLLDKAVTLLLADSGVSGSDKHMDRTSILNVSLKWYLRHYNTTFTGIKN